MDTVVYFIPIKHLCEMYRSPCHEVTSKHNEHILQVEVTRKFEIRWKLYIAYFLCINVKLITFYTIESKHKKLKAYYLINT